MPDATGPMLCFGELLLRLSAPGRSALFQYPTLDACFGGAEANVAVALSRIGTPAKVVSRVPDDAIGDAVIDHLRRGGVDASSVQAVPGRLGTYYLAPGAGPRAAAVIYDRENSVFAAAGPEDFDWPTLLANARGLHMSGITPALGPNSAALALAAARAAGEAGVPVSFDGNYRARLWERWGGEPRKVLHALVSETTILFGNHRDIALLLGGEFSGDGPERRREAAEAAFAAFPRLRYIASTARHAEDAELHRLSARIDARDGSFQTDEVEIAGIVDRIGTGDAFAAGVLHALGEGLEAAAETGLALAVLKHGTPGDVSFTGPRELAAFRAGGRDVRR
ncbi:sugar kinase [Sphingomonas quercus]|uniref:Sugar kinase n=1 Tax=Sphingomonas quercus TaxID=2842451 RepID=A0ABS6BJW2_9SPHN|nr:sugar kinase [Sphingomonas quercus]MBU3078588.1 sugar kinase [Sphingomonas quercus]